MDKEIISNLRREIQIKYYIANLLDNKTQNNFCNLLLCLINGSVVVPMAIVLSEKNQKKLEKKELEEIIKNNDEISMSPIFIENKKTKKKYLPIFSSNNDDIFDHRDEDLYINTSIDSCIEFVESDNEVSGIILNPYTTPIRIEDEIYDILKRMLKDVRKIVRLDDNKDCLDVYVSIIYDDDLIAKTVGEPTFYYRTNLPVKVGDKVLVDRMGEKVVGIVSKIEKYELEDVPYPIEKTKEIIKII